jgi:hypothetical protein
VRHGKRENGRENDPPQDDHFKLLRNACVHSHSRLVSHAPALRPRASLAPLHPRNLSGLPPAGCARECAGAGWWPEASPVPAGETHDARVARPRRAPCRTRETIVGHWVGIGSGAPRLREAHAQYCAPPAGPGRHARGTAQARFSQGWSGAPAEVAHCARASRRAPCRSWSC